MSKLIDSVEFTKLTTFIEKSHENIEAGFGLSKENPMSRFLENKDEIENKMRQIGKLIKENNEVQISTEIDRKIRLIMG